MPSLLDPKNDFVFKRLFAGAPHLLADLINAVRSGEAPVEVVEVLNPRIDPAELTGKFIVLDVLARDDTGRLFNIEMQVRRHADWPLRSAYYLARTLANQLKGGEEYGELKPVIGIHLMDFELFAQEQAHWCFELRDRHHSAVVLTSSLQLHLIELPKADRLRQGAQPAALADWIAYFEHWQEDTIMNAITHEPIRQAMQQLHELSADEDAQRMAFVRERALRDEKSELNAARREGQQEGRQQGRVAVLARQLQLKFGPLSESTRERLEQADDAHLDVWTERILSAQTLDEVFA
jgi:predicted transposase/invertase (TIGR01784 family)